jgi:hypothetical protein
MPGKQVRRQKKEGRVSWWGLLVNDPKSEQLLLVNAYEK